MRRAPAAAFALLLVAYAAPTMAQDIEKKRVFFASGESSATVKGSIQGYEVVDYVLGARAGQTMGVTMKTSNTSSYFNVLPPGSSDAAIFIGSTSGDEWTGILPADGDYAVRVYLMRNAARRDEKADYTLTFRITAAAEK